MIILKLKSNSKICKLVYSFSKSYLYTFEKRNFNYFKSVNNFNSFHHVRYKIFCTTKDIKNPVNQVNKEILVRKSSSINKMDSNKSLIDQKEKISNTGDSLEKFTEQYGHVIENQEILNKIQKRINFKKDLANIERLVKEDRFKRLKVGFTFGFFMIGVMSLWVVLYKTICEKYGYSVKSTHNNYKFAGKNINLTKKYTIKFISEVDVELPWEFYTQQEKVQVNSGETCLIFYKAKNKTDEPLIGISVYDVHPQGIAMYFNKIQCFCFENQLLAPREEVDLPVFFYIDPAINEDVNLDHYHEIILKYTFYLGKKQDLAKVMNEHLKKQKEEREQLKKIKIELNKKGKNYKIDDDEDNKFVSLPGMNPNLEQYYLEEKTNSEILKGNN